MPTLVIVGAQWGDEAKGKLVDVLAGEADLVVRYSGGNNAGHTVTCNGKQFKFQLLPAGILHPNVLSVLGGGMVICPKGLLEELDRTVEQAGSVGELRISPAAHVVFPYHRLLDGLEEESRGADKIGTTSRGIGPAYQDKVARTGIRMGELVDQAAFAPTFRKELEGKNRLLATYGQKPLDVEALVAEYQGYANQLRRYVREIDVVVQDAVMGGKKVMFEGAQGTFLDLDAGTYPFVTSSHPIAAGACLGTGIGPRHIDAVVGVCKAYTTRVGAGPFPTELHDGVGNRIREVGKEYGTVTGRGRRCGWLDLHMLRHSCRLNSMSGLVVTRLDVLSGFESLQVCVGYEADGKEIAGIPSGAGDMEKVKPMYRTAPGWSGDLTGARKLGDLPETARAYLQMIEEFTETPVVMVSVGPDREETIHVKPQLLWGE